MNEFELQHLPEAYRPLSPWSYFGLGILYALPLLGWIFLIVHAIGSANINRRNYARMRFAGVRRRHLVCQMRSTVFFMGKNTGIWTSTARESLPFCRIKYENLS